MASQTGDFDTREIKQRLKRAGKQMTEAARMGVMDGGQLVLQRSTDVVPHEYGDLEDSGRVRLDPRKSSINAIVSYDTPYAVEQHENLHFRHNHGRQAKYLEKPLNGSGRDVRKLIVNRMNGVR